MVYTSLLVHSFFSNHSLLLLSVKQSFYLIMFESHMLHMYLYSLQLNRTKINDERSNAKACIKLHIYHTQGIWEKSIPKQHFNDKTELCPVCRQRSTD